MKYAADFRSIARNALSGKWGLAVITGVIASLLGAIASNGPEIKFNMNSDGANVGLEFAGQPIYTTGAGWNEQITGFLIGSAIYVVIAALAMAVVYFILGSVVNVGYAKFNLDLVDRQKEPEIGTLFAYFKDWKTTATASLLHSTGTFPVQNALPIPTT